jgi:hypothetical protein
MLTEPEKDKIRAEEIFRNEVRSSLTEKLSPLGKFMKFLSSSLGLWILSTLFVTIGGYAFSEYKSSAEANRKKEETIRRLDSEISYRLTGFRNQPPDVGIEKALFLLERPNDSQNPQYLFLENEKRPLSALLWELIEIVPGKEKSEIRQAYTTVLRFGAVRANKSSSFARFFSEKLLASGVPLQFAKDFNLPRWGKQFDNRGKPDTLWGGLISLDVLSKKVSAAEAPPCLRRSTGGAEATGQNASRVNSKAKTYPGIDLSEDIGAIRDTGQEGATVGFSIAYAIQAAVSQRSHESVTVSPRGIYESAKRHDEWEGESYFGTSLLGGLKAVREEGVYLEKDWAFSCGAKPAPNTKPFLKIRSFSKLSGIEDIPAALRAKKAVIALVHVTDELSNARKNGRVSVKLPISPIGSKTVTIVGYDEKGQEFKVANDWGTAWGDKGFGYVKGKDLKLLLQDAYTIEL